MSGISAPWDLYLVGDAGQFEVLKYNVSSKQIFFQFLSYLWTNIEIAFSHHLVVYRGYFLVQWSAYTWKKR